MLFRSGKRATGGLPYSCGASRNGLELGLRYTVQNGKRPPTVFWNVMQVITTDNNGSVHFGGHNLACKDTTANGDVASEGAFFV